MVGFISSGSTVAGNVPGQALDSWHEVSISWGLAFQMGLWWRVGKGLDGGCIYNWSHACFSSQEPIVVVVVVVIVGVEAE